MPIYFFFTFVEYLAFSLLKINKQSDVCEIKSNIYKITVIILYINKKNYYNNIHIYN